MRKMGVVPALCANGYDYRIVFTTNVQWLRTIEVLKTPVRLYKQIKKIQKKLKSKDLMYDKQELITSLKENMQIIER